MENVLEKIVKSKKTEELNKLNAVKIVNSLFGDLMERERDVLVRRFGLNGNESETLEKIGGLHNLTRERVRQIEAGSIKKLKKLENLETYLADIKKVVSELLSVHGGLMEQEFLLDILALFCIDAKSSDNERELYKKNFDFIISKLLEDHVEKTDKSDKFNPFYSIKDQAVSHLEEIVGELTGKINKIKQTVDIEELLAMIKGLDSYTKHQNKLNSGPDSDITSIFKSEVFPELGEIINTNKPLYSLIQAAKNIDRNKFGNWGLSDWPEINPKKISDKIYLVLKNNGEPMHFTEIADKINEVGFDHKKANSGTCHNELILDDRYVLTDRGMYGLKEWNK
ncbi:hypothetical protein COY54_01120 [Candidatus Falkowbacteria bacterium CG_4_10_14_0_8_um_filter_41_36]|uniref:HTH HARE-type domain-containing protein n=2 Tax=Candidatus Falkowiibacteriota TaxID=1752728 RepID=A0A1J4T8T4_9BACT|nr:MAG: hypothetical protein AUJ35_03100 [Candidatus Falkowbacteria bacterium CG1_02_41_21]PIZ10759.1 MAG: hypothetical protein COY54_01120 [Candidatus Falkowbacteria bacterium CG_4_10_14_0_8_um_filter_41_36]